MYVRRKGSDVFESGDDLSFDLSCPLICFVLESFLVTCFGMRVTSVHYSFSGIAPKPLEPKPSSRSLALARLLACSAYRGLSGGRRKLANNSLFSSDIWL